MQQEPKQKNVNTQQTYGIKFLLRYFSCLIDRVIDIIQLRGKVKKPAVLVVLLKSIGFIPYAGNNGKNGNGSISGNGGDGISTVYHLPVSVSSGVTKVYLTRLLCTMDDMWIKIDEILDMIQDIHVFYNKCVESIENDCETDEKQQSVSVNNVNIIKNGLNQVKMQLDPIIQNMVFECRKYLESPYELYECVSLMNRNIKHMLGVLSIKNLNIKYSGDRWKCWLCNKSNNSILRDITCPQCGDISINSSFISIQTQSLSFNGKLKYGIAKLASCSNANTNKTKVNFLSYFGLVRHDVFAFSCFEWSQLKCHNEMRKCHVI